VSDREAILDRLSQWPASDLVAQAAMAPALGSWEPVISRMDGKVMKSVWVGPAVTDDVSLDMRRRIAEARARGLLMELRQRENENE
jgi:hypothetical protein